MPPLVRTGGFVPTLRLRLAHGALFFLVAVFAPFSDASEILAEAMELGHRLGQAAAGAHLDFGHFFALSDARGGRAV